jgi:competence protein ComEC
MCIQFAQETLMLSLNVLPTKKQLSPPAALRACLTTGYFMSVAMAFACIFPQQRTPPPNPLSVYAAQRSESLEPQFRNRELAKNFLSNERSLPSDLSADMKNTGISHLLAISGAQVSFVLPIITAGLLQPLGMALTWWVRPHILAKALGWGRALAETFVALLCAALFGATGSLTRVAVFRSASHARIVRRLALTGAGAFRFLPINTLPRTLFLLICAFWLGNPFANLSFLLSATGASIAFMSSQWFRAIRKGWQKACLTTTITTLVMSVLLAPIFPSNPGQSILANLIAIPVVTWLITPLSILLLLGPPTTIEKYGISFLDVSLDIFRSTAEALASHSAANGTTITQAAAAAYLAFCMSALWAFEDTKSTRRLLSGGP